MNEQAGTARWLVWSARAATVGLAALYVLRPGLLRAEWPSLPVVWDLFQREVAIGWAAGVAKAAAIEFARWVPCGLLARISLGRRDSWVGRVTAGWLPALAFVAVVAAAARLVETRTVGPVFVGLALAGGVVGVWAGAAALAGPRKLAWFLPKLGVATLVAALGGLGLGHLALSSTQAAITETSPTSADRVRLAVGLRAPADSAGLHTIRLEAADVGLLVAWRWPPDQRRWRLQTSFPSDRLLIDASAPIATVGRTLGLSALLAVSVGDGKVVAVLESLQIGKLAIPVALVQPFFRRMVDHALVDPHVRRLLEHGETAEITGSVLVVRGRRPAADQELLSRLAGVAGTTAAPLETIRLYVVRLLDAPQASASGDTVFEGLFRSCFGLARERSTTGDPAAENRAALLALGLVLGHTRLESMMGTVLDDAQRRRANDVARRASIRERGDWSRHLAVSAALTLLGAPDLSDMGGLLKEELDANGGSGFSFADLLADRSGTTLAVWATRDRQTADLIQQRLAAGVPGAQLLPDPAGLVEGLDADTLTARFGGVGGAEYERVVRDIEDRIARLALYQTSAAAPPSAP